MKRRLITCKLIVLKRYGFPIPIPIRMDFHFPSKFKNAYKINYSNRTQHGFFKRLIVSLLTGQVKGISWDFFDKLQIFKKAK